MITRILFDDASAANAAAEALFEAGFEAAVITERFDDEDDAEYVVATPADDGQVRAILGKPAGMVSSEG